MLTTTSAQPDQSLIEARRQQTCATAPLGSARERAVAEGGLR